MQIAVLSKEVMKIVRERAVLKAAQIPENLKTRMLGELDARMSRLEKTLREADEAAAASPRGSEPAAPVQPNKRA